MGVRGRFMHDQYFDLRSIIGVLRRRARLIAGIVAAVLAVTACVLLTVTPQYRASALVMVDPSRKDLLDPSAMQAMSTSGDNARLDSEVEIVKSVPIMLRVIETVGLLGNPGFLPDPGTRQQLLSLVPGAARGEASTEEIRSALVGQLMRSVSVQRRGLTYLLVISAEAAHPETAADIANAVAAAYIEAQLHAKVATVEGALAVLKPRVDEALSAVIASEGAYERLIEESIQRIVEVGGRPDLAALKGRLALALDEQSRLVAQMELTSDALGQEKYEILSSSLQSNALALLEKERGALSSRSQQVSSEGARALREQVGRLSERLVLLAQQDISALREELRQSLLRGDLPPEVLTGIYGLQQNAALARANYDLLVARVNDLNNQAAVQVADSRIVTPATAPTSPSFPNTGLVLAIAVFGALGLGTGMAFVVDNYVGGFTAPEQMEAVTRREVAVSLPPQKELRHAEASSASLADAVVLAPLSPFSERLRLLRLRIDQALNSAAQRAANAPIIVVTSSGSGEGKTTTAIGLARTYAGAGERVLLIDCDLRSPGISQKLGIEASDGFYDLLSGALTAAELTSLVSQDPLSEVSVVIGARHSEAPTEHLLTHSRFLKLLEAGRTVFDVVILDTPAIDVAVDGIYLLRHADAIVFLTRWGQTTQRQVLRSLDAVERSKRADAPVFLAMTGEPG